MSKQIQIAIFLLSFMLGYSQKQVKMHDKGFYIIDSIKPELFGADDKVLIDSSLNLFHQAQSDTEKVKSLMIISENGTDENVWRAYNYLIVDICKKNINDQALTEIERNKYNFLMANAFNNEAYALSAQKNFRAALLLHLRALKIRQKIQDWDGVGNSLGNIASDFDENSNILMALKFYQLAYKIKVRFSSKKVIATVLNNLGSIYQRFADTGKALDYFHKSLKLFEEIKDSLSVANLYLNLSEIYETQGHNDKSLEECQRALTIYTNMNFLPGKARALYFCAGSYSEINQLQKAEEFYLRSKSIYDSIGDKFGMSVVTNNLGYFYKKSKKYDKALELYFISLKYKEELKYKQEIAFCLNNIGSLYFDTGDLPKAKSYALRSYEIAKEIKLPENLKKASALLKRIYNKEGNYKMALEMMELAVTMRDSLRNEQTEKSSYEQQVKYTYDKQQAVFEAEQKKELEKREAVSEAENKRKNMMILFVCIGLFLVLIFSFFLFRRFRFEQKQKKTIQAQKMLVENQKHLIEEKQKEILDSISYAKRLQEAILPTEKRFKENLPESFILYQPKDIVAGDFYWMEVVNDLVLVAAADCTGHGVPGAMVSVVCSGALNRAVLEFGLTEPGKILDKTRELVLETFSRSDQEVKDGMDISLASINSKTGEIKWSGANNPLWYFEAGELKEIVAHKQPIGKSDVPTNFPTHKINLQKGNTLYLFTDGYADQFGGPKGKKFKYKKMAELLTEIQVNDLASQKKILSGSFQEWKGELEQVDDVCILGIKIT